MQQPTLTITRIFNASVERVFSAWTRSDYMAQWFGPEQFTVERAELDLTVGGLYDIQLRAPDQKLIRHFGEYLEITTNTSLVFTWVLDNQDCDGSTGLEGNTLVSLSFKALGQKTELILQHEKLPNKDAFNGHSFGWTSSMDSLESFLNT
jgi:uncharacterized protein YndB with AHSA1/START domain